MRSAVLAIDHRRHVVGFTAEAGTLFGVGAEEILGRPYGLAFTEDAAWTGLDRLLVKARDAAKSCRARIEVPVPGGTRHLRVTARRMRWRDGGTPAPVQLEVKDVTERVQAWRRRFEGGLLRKLMLATFAISLVANLAVVAIVPVDTYSITFAWVYLLALLVPVALFVRRLASPLAQFGVTWVNSRKSIIEGLLLSAILVPVALGLALGRHAAVGTPAVGDMDVLGWGLPSLIDPKEIELIALLYLPHAFLQEFVARGVLQSSIARFLGEATGGWRSVALAAGVFGVHHLYLGALAVGVTFLSGLFFGWIYLRHRNLVGVTLVHFFVGWTAFMFGLL